MKNSPQVIELLTSIRDAGPDGMKLPVQNSTFICTLLGYVEENQGTGKHVLTIKGNRCLPSASGEGTVSLKNEYRPLPGETCLVSGPNSDDGDHFVFKEMKLIGGDETFAVFKEEKCWPVTIKWKEITVKPLDVHVWTKDNIVSGQYVCKQRTPGGDLGWQTKWSYQVGYFVGKRDGCLISLSDGMIAQKDSSREELAAFLNKNDMIPMTPEWLLDSLEYLGRIDKRTPPQDEKDELHG